MIIGSNASEEPPRRKTTAERNLASKESRSTVKFEEWKRKHDWVERTEGDGKQSVYCGPCHRQNASSPWADKEQGIKTPKLDDCNKHSAAAFHKEVS